MEIFCAVLKSSEISLEIQIENQMLQFARYLAQKTINELGGVLNLLNSGITHKEALFIIELADNEL